MDHVKAFEIETNFWKPKSRAKSSWYLSKLLATLELVFNQVTSLKNSMKVCFLHEHSQLLIKVKPEKWKRHYLNKLTNIKGLEGWEL